jgi:predicted nucleotidyltransferase
VVALAQTFPEGSFAALYLFGSYSRGEATPDSDVDILVYPRKGLDYFALGRLNETLREELGKSVDTSIAPSMPEAILRNASKDRILLYSSSNNFPKDS